MRMNDLKMADDAESSGRAAARNALEYNDFEFSWRELDDLKISKDTSEAEASEAIRAAVLAGRLRPGNGHRLRDFIKWWLEEDAEEGGRRVYLPGVLAGKRATALTTAFVKGYASVLAREAVREAKARAEDAERERRLDEEDEG